MKSVLMMLVRNFIVFGIAYAWLFKGIAGAGNAFAAYVFIVAAFTLVAAFIPIEPEKVLHAKYHGLFLRTLDVIGQWALFAALIWFGHFVVAAFWTLMCFSISAIRNNGMKAKKKAQLAWMERDKAAIMDAFKGLSEENAFCHPDRRPDRKFAGVGINEPSFGAGQPVSP